MKLFLSVILTSLLFCSCVSSYGGPASTSNAFLLSEHTSEDGVRTKFRVQSDRESGPSVLRVETRSIEVAFLGINARSVGRSYAEAQGLEPWRGIRITALNSDSAADNSGMLAGDLLLSLAGEELASVEEFEELVAALLQPGVPVSAVVLRKNSEGSYIEKTLEITPGSRTIEDSTTERIQLEAPDELVMHTGMQVATLDAELALDSGIGDSSVALVTSVVAGASAYDSGIRSGDRILECNGVPVSSAAEVLQAAMSADMLDVVVDGRLGEHRAGVGTNESVDSRTRLHIPIIIDHTKRVNRTRTSFLDFIFQFGFNYDRIARTSSTRQPSVETSLSILPLGMFEFKRTPDYNRNTLFWFITWSSQR